jgi:hypothetical protein
MDDRCNSDGDVALGMVSAYTLGGLFHNPAHIGVVAVAVQLINGRRLT